MDTTDIVDRLASHRTVGAAPREELAWLAAHGRLHRARVGESMTRDADMRDAMTIVLSGHMVIHVDRGLGPRKVMESSAGDVAGWLPYSRMDKPPGDVVVDEPGDFFLIERKHFPEMIRECPTVTAAVVHLMLDRARTFTSSDLQDEKMMSLGRLSASLAHELNNPASAAARSARLLIDELASLESASRALGAARLTDAQVKAVDRLRSACHPAVISTLSPIQRADREDAVSMWLERHDADTDAAAALVDTALTIEDLDSLASALDPGALITALRWLAADCSSRMLATDVEKAVTRVHDLVARIKRYTYMDRTSAPEAIELADGLNDAVALLLHKARAKSVAISVSLEPNLPCVRAIGSDLNQVWMNLIDNALDAVSESGHITITAARHLAFVIVRVVDDGHGIPAEIRNRIFEPFFTSKPVGQGTGQGLDIARGLVRRNGGDIEFQSRPGHTEFLVSVPVVPDASG